MGSFCTQRAFALSGIAMQPQVMRRLVSDASVFRIDAFDERFLLLVSSKHRKGCRVRCASYVYVYIYMTTTIIIIIIVYTVSINACIVDGSFFFFC